jgi:tetratricopeptide (TPR) repeat protein/peroxiredoxin
MPYFRSPSSGLSRRTVLKGLGFAPVLLRAAPLMGLMDGLDEPVSNEQSASFLTLADVRYRPHDPEDSPLADVLRLVAPGSDSYITEKYAVEIENVLRRWGAALQTSTAHCDSLGDALDGAMLGTSMDKAEEQTIRSAHGVHVMRRRYDGTMAHGRAEFLAGLQEWLTGLAAIRKAEFEIFAIEPADGAGRNVQTQIRYDLVAERNGGQVEERVGSWRVRWASEDAKTWLATEWEAGEETVSAAAGKVFIEVTEAALGGIDSYRKQMLHGADYWRTTLDGAVGMDLYCNNGLAMGDYDNDGFDDLYVCQAAGLPNRLYRNRGDGTFEDVTEKAGVGVLDNTACALFADFDNRGFQDLLVVCGTGPLLFRNEGDGTFKLKPDAFQFKRPPQGTFTHAAIADYDRDGRVDIYFCLYMYYLGLDQYHYPIPYYDARNGPPNCLFHNEGSGRFVEVTEPAGLDVENNRYSFACAWGDSNGNGLPDLFVSNDFGTSQLYQNNGNGTFTVVSRQAGVEGVGAGMACTWCDFDNDGHEDVYVPSMWEAAGQRVSEQPQFHPDAPPRIRELYQRHARGNALYHNQGDGTFLNVGRKAGVEMGRWSWSSDFWDFDHDGYPDLYVANGYISGLNREDMASFFWRQVVAKSSEDSTPARAYEKGWNAINELIRSDYSWHGLARNVLFANNQDGSFSEISGPAGMDFMEDSRTFVVADLDHDGRLEVVLKNRNAPQLRMVHNVMTDLGHAICFQLRGTKSNRDAIGASVTVEAGGARQTRYLHAGTGFLAQHTKEILFGLGTSKGPICATVRWPNGTTQEFENLPVQHRVRIEEGASLVQATPFADTARAFTRETPAHEEGPLPTDLGTWLIEPLKAPDFNLPDGAGTMHSLRALQGGFVLLAFWSIDAPLSLEALQALQREEAGLQRAGVKILAINMDRVPALQRAQAYGEAKRMPFPVLFGSDEVCGVYNILYRHMFDRRRTLGIPTYLLVDGAGMIVKVYQGRMDAWELQRDVRSIPTTPDARMAKALPFHGLLIQDQFQRNDFTYGVAMFQHGYLDEAAQSFRQVIAVKPNNADAYYNLGTLSLRRQDLAGAIEYLQKTVELNPDYPEAWNNLGMIAAQQGRADQAIEDFERSLKLRPHYGIALLNLGNVYRRMRQFEKASEYLDRALREHPDDPEVHYSLGMLYAQQDQMQQAEAFLTKAIALRPAYPEALNNLGVLYVHEQNYASAEAQFQKGIEVAPAYGQSYLNLANLYIMLHEREKARAVLEEMLRVMPNNAVAQQMLGQLQ